MLEALAAQEDITVQARDLEIEITRHALERGVDPREMARAIEAQGTLNVVVGDVVRRKAIDLLVEAANVDGGPTDEQLSELEHEPEAETELGLNGGAAEAEVGPERDREDAEGGE